MINGMIKVSNLQGKAYIADGNIPVNNIESISFEGDSYIILSGVKASNAMTIEVDFIRESAKNYAFVFGSRSSNTSNDGIALAYSSSNCFPIFGSDRSNINSTSSISIRHIAKIGQSGYVLDEETIKTYENMNFVGTYDLTIGALNNGGDIDNRAFKGKIYSVKIYLNNIIYKNLVPVERTYDSAIGLYDTLGGDFYILQEMSSNE